MRKRAAEDLFGAESYGIPALESKRMSRSNEPVSFTEEYTRVEREPPFYTALRYAGHKNKRNARCNNHIYFAALFFIFQISVKIFHFASSRFIFEIYFYIYRASILFIFFLLEIDGMCKRSATENTSFGSVYEETSAKRLVKGKSGVHWPLGPAGHVARSSLREPRRSRCGPSSEGMRATCAIGEGGGEGNR